MTQTSDHAEDRAEHDPPECGSRNEQQYHGDEHPEREYSCPCALEGERHAGQRRKHDQHVAVAEIDRLALAAPHGAIEDRQREQRQGDAEREREEAGARQANATERQQRRLPHEEDGGGQQCHRHEDFAEPRRNGARPGALLLRVRWHVSHDAADLTRPIRYNAHWVPTSCLIVVLLETEVLHHQGQPGVVGGDHLCEVIGRLVGRA